MWVFLNNAMLSIVENRDDDGGLLVRGRIEGDIARVFPEAQVDFTPEFDYAYRAFVRREDVAEAIASAVTCIDYDNFKNSIPGADRPRHDAYLNVWFVLRDFQEDQQLEVSRRKYG